MNLRIHCKISRAVNDPEKCLLPTILYVNCNHPSFEDLRENAFMLALGWWDWSVKAWFVFNKETP